MEHHQTAAPGRVAEERNVQQKSADADGNMGDPPNYRETISPGTNSSVASRTNLNQADSPSGSLQRDSMMQWLRLQAQEKVLQHQGYNCGIQDSLEIQHHWHAQQQQNLKLCQQQHNKPHLHEHERQNQQGKQQQQQQHHEILRQKLMEHHQTSAAGRVVEARNVQQKNADADRNKGHPPTYREAISPGTNASVASRTNLNQADSSSVSLKVYRDSYPGSLQRDSMMQWLRLKAREKVLQRQWYDGGIQNSLEIQQSFFRKEQYRHVQQQQNEKLCQQQHNRPHLHEHERQSEQREHQQHQPQVTQHAHEKNIPQGADSCGEKGVIRVVANGTFHVGGCPDSTGDHRNQEELKVKTTTTPGMNCIKIGLPGKSILRDYFQENRISRRKLLLRINFPGRPIFIQLPPEVTQSKNPKPPQNREPSPSSPSPSTATHIPPFISAAAMSAMRLTQRPSQQQHDVN